ncbi:MAG: TetR family transcriptional regulator [Microbacterium sp.]|jgi:AcrR family transcriptional regulator|uniref:TetR/AcrR family transcriptional regulator n=1 Tax=unclassified Microbacterium TaxID=2609290 RepID=UPI000DB3630C|nr:TetR/AcrR family transcriptional regulator [Microbacterium sp.]PZU36358.1 MAG: TetR family transcriptional regulator [Microbacterium sp.]
MATTRERALDAALDLVGEQGIRALTHARVDERAGLPKGSTSNWFRTRAALIAGLITAIAEGERSDAARGPRPRPRTPGELVDMLCRFIEVETGESAARTRVRLALSLEASLDPDLIEPLVRQREVFVDWMADLLRDVGAQHPVPAARFLLAAGNGITFHRLTVDPDAQIRPVIERAVRACLD